MIAWAEAVAFVIAASGVSAIITSRLCSRRVQSVYEDGKAAGLAIARRKLSAGTAIALLDAAWDPRCEVCDDTGRIEHRDWKSGIITATAPCPKCHPKVQLFRSGNMEVVR